MKQGGTGAVQTEGSRPNHTTHLSTVASCMKERRAWIEPAVAVEPNPTRWNGGKSTKH